MHNAVLHIWNPFQRYFNSKHTRKPDDLVIMAGNDIVDLGAEKA